MTVGGKACISRSMPCSGSTFGSQTVSQYCSCRPRVEVAAVVSIPINETDDREEVCLTWPPVVPSCRRLIRLAFRRAILSALVNVTRGIEVDNDSSWTTAVERQQHAQDISERRLEWLKWLRWLEMTRTCQIEITLLSKPSSQSQSRTLLCRRRGNEMASMTAEEGDCVDDCGGRRWRWRRRKEDQFEAVDLVWERWRLGSTNHFCKLDSFAYISVCYSFHQNWPLGLVVCADPSNA